MKNWLLAVCLLFTSSLVFAGVNQHVYYRTFLHPLLDDVRLAWCEDGGKICGKATASRYCRLMGYDSADSVTIAHDLGETRYIANNKLCRGWECDGFNKIKCIATKTRSPTPSFYYRKRKFNYPRYHHQRIAWCYANDKGCGRKVAQSFCRRMGYMRQIGYVKAPSAYATEQIGSNQLCYGTQCAGFRSISCFR